MLDKFSYLEDLIEELSSKNKYIVLVFLLKCQIVEYALKYLLGGYPYKPKGFIPNGFFDKATIGMVIKKLDKLDDDYLDEIVEKAKKFNKIRVYIVHHFLTSTASIPEIETTLHKRLELADEIEADIHHLFDFISENYYGGYSYEELSLIGIV